MYIYLISYIYLFNFLYIYIYIYYQISASANFFMSHAKSNPLIGEADDSIIGSFEITRNNVRFDKYHTCL